LAGESDQPELEELLRRCAAGDASALQLLHRRVAPQLLAVLMRLLRTRAQAEDALQDAFIRIWQEARQFDQSRGRAMAWMVSIARNRAIDQLRSTRPTLVLDAAELADAEQLQTAGPAERTEFSRTQTALWRCLEALGAQQRQCLVLAYQYGLTQQRIAVSIAQPLGSVKSWVRRGLQSHRECPES
jgi:RNA polymerase sigma-70 factor (ECF subfamily)